MVNANNVSIHLCGLYDNSYNDTSYNSIIPNNTFILVFESNKVMAYTGFNISFSVGKYLCFKITLTIVNFS